MTQQSAIKNAYEIIYERIHPIAARDTTSGEKVKILDSCELCLRQPEDFDGEKESFK